MAAAEAATGAAAAVVAAAGKNWLAADDAAPKGLAAAGVAVATVLFCLTKYPGTNSKLGSAVGNAVDWATGAG